MTYPNDDRFTLIKAARLINGTGAPPIARAAILIQGGVVVGVGPQHTIVAPQDAPVDVLDYGDRTILPGLIDSHVHLIGIGDGRVGDDLATLPDEILTLQAAQNSRLHLYSGVTTVRDCGAKNRTTHFLRQAVRMGIAEAPRLLLSLRPMAIIGGHLSYFGIQATGVDECRAAVRQLVKEGADFIKITATGGSTATSYPMLPSFDIDEMTAIVEEAHRFGKHAAGPLRFRAGHGKRSRRRCGHHHTRLPQRPGRLMELPRGHRRTDGGTRRVRQPDDAPSAQTVSGVWKRKRGRNLLLLPKARRSTKAGAIKKSDENTSPE